MNEVTPLRREKLIRIRGLVRKETHQVLRDPSSILVALILPLILLFLFGYGVTFDPRFFTIGLVIEQPTPVIESNEEVCRIYHYSNPISLSATNRILTHE